MLASASRQTLFTDRHTSFCQAFKNYCAQMGSPDLTLTENELQQLSWHMSSAHVTPEARNGTSFAELHFEIKRCFARRISFELLLAGDETSYERFIADKAEPRFTHEAFQTLANEAQSLSDDVKTVVRLSCLLAMNEMMANRFNLIFARDEEARLKLRADHAISISDEEYEELTKCINLIGNKLSTDTEEFLTQISKLLAYPKLRALLPIASSLTDDQAVLLSKVYWPNTHLRHMLQTEGGDNMTASFNKGIAEGLFSREDFPAWKWRWLTTSFGFQAGKAAKYYDQNVHVLTKMVTSELEKSFTHGTDYSFVDGYLLNRAQLAGLNIEASLAEGYFLGHLAAFSNQVQIVDENTGAIIRSAYEAYKIEINAGSDLAETYHAARKNLNAVTPTYVTSVYSNAYAVHYKQLTTKNEMSPEAAKIVALKYSTIFICQLMASLYQNSLEQRISMQEFSRVANLERIYIAWLANIKAWEFKINTNNEMTAVEVEKPALTPRMN